MRTLSVIAVLLICALPALGDVIVEKSSKVEFPAEITVADAGGESHALRATGTGLRKKMIFKVYAACFYADKRAELGEDPYMAAIEGNFAKKIVMHFMRDVDAEKISGAFHDGIRKTLEEGHDADVDTFVGHFQEEVMKGETIELEYLPGEGLRASQAGAELGQIGDIQVIAAIWATWFGDDPISGDLKRGLLGL